MIRRPPRSTLSSSSAASDVYKRQMPFVVLTSNRTRDLSEALRRRCLYLYIDFPDQERELEIIRLRVPGIGEDLARRVLAVVRSIRQMDLKKVPSISETLDLSL